MNTENALMMLRSENYFESQKAAWELVGMGESAVPGLLEALEDPAPEVRYRAAWALGKIGDLRAIDPLIRAFNDNDSYVQWSAAEALAEINESKTVELLIQALDDNSSDVRETAAQALGSIGNT